MRKLVAYELLSLDGVAERPDDFVTDFDEVMVENLVRVIADQDAVLLGRRTYDEWAAYWPQRHGGPFASFINGVAKHVVTSTEPDFKWDHSTFIRDRWADNVRTMKEQAGGDIGVHGSIALMQSLFSEGLVDELRLVVAPALQASGRRLFEGGKPQRLALTRQAVSPTGHLLLDFRVGGAS